jgi:hypothetical protein
MPGNSTERTFFGGIEHRYSLLDSNTSVELIVSIFIRSTQGMNTLAHSRFTSGARVPNLDGHLIYDPVISETAINVVTYEFMNGNSLALTSGINRK